MFSQIKNSWHKFLIWIGVRKPIPPEKPIHMAFAIMGFKDLRDITYNNNLILPSERKGKMIPNKDPAIGYKGQGLPNAFQPDAKLKYTYINEEKRTVRYFDNPQTLDGFVILDHYDPQYFYNIEKLEAEKKERDNGDIIDRLNYAKDCYQPTELFDEAIQEIMKLRDLVKEK
jgi:hypothetical protein